MKRSFLIILSLITLHRLSAELPEVHVKSTLRLKKVERELLDRPNSIAKALVISHQPESAGFLWMPDSKPIERVLLDTSSGGSLSLSRELLNDEPLDLVKYLEALGIANIKFQLLKSNNHAIALLHDTQEQSFPLFEVLIESEQGADATSSRQFIILQNWNVVKSPNPQNFENNSHNHKFFKHSLRSNLNADKSLEPQIKEWISKLIQSNSQSKPSEKSFKDIVTAFNKHLEEKGFTVELLFDENEHQLYQINQKGVDAFQVTFTPIDDEFVGITCTEIDHVFEFRVRRKDFQSLDTFILNELDVLLTQNFSEKLTILNISTELESILKNKNCGADFSKGTHNKHQGYSLFKIRKNDACFNAETEISVIRYISGFFQIAHLQFNNSFFNSEYIVPCGDRTEFNNHLTNLFNEINQVSLDLAKDFEASQKDEAISLTKLAELIKTLLHVDLNLSDETKLPTERYSDDKFYFCKLDFKEGLYTLSISYRKPKEVTGTYSTQISFPKINSYDQLAYIEKQLKKFIGNLPKS